MSQLTADQLNANDLADVEAARKLLDPYIALMLIDWKEGDHASAVHHPHST